MSDETNSSLGLAVFGASEFTLGFELSGVRTVISTEGLSQTECLDKLLASTKRQDIGILIVDEDSLQGIASHERATLENSIRPVVLIMSKKANDTSTLRRQIIRAIGVDMYSDEAQ